MKKHRKLFIAVFIQTIFLIQLMSCKANTSAEVMATMGLPYLVAYYKEITEKTAAGGIGVAALTFGLWLDKKVEELIDKSMREDARLIKGLDKLQEDIDVMSGGIEERISQLLNQEYAPKFELFCTNKSKIFVLQNIEDFFEFSQDPKYKIFNSLIYEICIKKINELEKQTVSGVEKDIDIARDHYIAMYGILIEQLKRMPLELINERIDAIENEVDRLGKDYNEETVERSNINALALISILGYLEYVRKHKLKEIGDEHGLVKIVEESEPHEKIIEKVLLEDRKMQRTPQTISFFSRLRAAFNSWWYGTNQ